MFILFLLCFLIFLLFWGSLVAAQSSRVDLAFAKVLFLFEHETQHETRKTQKKLKYAATGTERVTKSEKLQTG